MDEQRIYIYYPPQKGEVRRIWDVCELGISAGTNTVRQSLIVWVYNNTHMKNSKITWKDPSGVGYQMTWSALLRWFEVSCRRELLVIKADGSVQVDERTALSWNADRGHSEKNRADDGKGECAIL